VGAIEQVLVEDIVSARWHMNRVRKMEPGFFAMRREVLKDRIEDFSTLDPQAHLALIVLDDARDADTLGKMSRYEARFERSFHKALKELQRLQALRAALSDSGNGTVSQNPISPDPEAPIPLPPEALGSETRNPKSEIRNPLRTVLQDPVSPDPAPPNSLPRDAIESEIRHPKSIHGTGEIGILIP
jgi:hypothetical protein